MFKVVARYLVSQETYSNYYGRIDPTLPVVHSYGAIDSATELVIYNDTVDDQDVKLIEPVLQLGDNSAGSFEFTMPTCNVGYGRLGRMITEIYVYQSEEEIWRGRILSEENDIYNRKKYYCEGELAYLNDTMVPPADYKDYDIGALVREVITAHNNQLIDDQGYGKFNGINKLFELGVVEIHNTKNNEDYVRDGGVSTNFEKTLEVINNIVEEFKGHIQIRHQDGRRVLDIVQDLKTGSMAGQTINFGENLKDFTRKFDMSNICTAVLALGKLPSDFKPKGNEIANSTGSLASNVTFLPLQVASKWVDGFAMYMLPEFIVHASYQVTGGKKYLISSRLPNGMVAMSYVDKNGNFLSCTKHDGSQWNQKEFSVPSDCVAMSVANYGVPPLVALAPDQEDDINVPTTSDVSSLSSDATSQIYENAGIDTESTSSEDLPSITDIAGSDYTNGYLEYFNSYLAGQGSGSGSSGSGSSGSGTRSTTNLLRDSSSSSGQETPIQNRERYVTYKTSPVLYGPGAVYTSAIIEDRDIITYNLNINTVRIDVQRTKTDEEVKFIFSSRMDYPFMVYAILDASGAIIDSKTVSEIVDKGTKHNDFIEETITVPPRGVTLLVSSQADYDFHVWNYNQLYDKVNMYLTVEDINNGSAYVTNDTAIETYGWIAKSIEFEVEDKTTLLSKATQYLQEIQFDKMEINVTAADLAYISDDVRSFKLYEVVRCVSAPHGLDAKFPVTSVNLPLDKPDQVQYTLGDTNEPDYTEANNDTEIDLVNLIKKIPSRESVLVEAKRNATEIMNRYCHGYVTIVEDDPRFGSCIYISDGEDYQNSNRQWLWSLNGLGYSNDGGKTFGLAMTMDGSIVADYITAGTMSADRIRTGLLIDLEGKNYWNMENGDIAIGLNLKTCKVLNAQEYYGDENGNTYPTSNNDIELGSWIYDRTNHDYNFRSMFGSGTNLVDGYQGFSGPVTDENGNPVMEDWYNPKTGLMEKRQKQRYWVYISASMISTGILKGKNGRLWFDLNSGSLWVAGPSRLELNSNGDVLYPDGNGGWTLEPSAVEKHIKFEEGALFGYSNARWSQTTEYYDVNSDYSSKDNSMADVDHDQRGKHRIFTTTNMTGGTCEGFLDLVSTYGEDNGSKQYDVLLAGSNRVHINFGNSLLIGQSSSLWDIDPWILVTATKTNFAIGDVERPANRVDLEVYGDAQIGHKLSEIKSEDQSSISTSSTAPDQTTADKYKGDLTVNGGGTFGRNYYTEEVTQTTKKVKNKAKTSKSGTSNIATGTDEYTTKAVETKKKKYYDTFTFYANVKIEGQEGLTADSLGVKNNMHVGTACESSPENLWDDSWKFTNSNEEYVAEQTYSDNNYTTMSNDDFNSVTGDILFNGRVQFVGGTVGMPDGRLVIGAREEGNTGRFSLPQQNVEISYTGTSKLLMKNYYGLICGVPDERDGWKAYDIYNSRLVVEGNSLLFGDVYQVGGTLCTENFLIRDVVPTVTYTNNEPSYQYSQSIGMYYNSYHKRFTIHKPFILTEQNLSKYNEDAQSGVSLLHGLYLDNNIPLVLNSGIYYEGTDETDGLVISAIGQESRLTKLSGSSQDYSRYIRHYKITLKGTIYQEDGGFYISDKISYYGTSSEGLVLDASLSTNPKTGNARPATSQKVTIKSDTYLNGYNFYITSAGATKAAIYSNGRIDGRCLDVSNYTDETKVVNNSSYVTGEGAIAGRSLAIFGTNSYVNKHNNRLIQARINSDGSTRFTSLDIGPCKNINDAYQELSYIYLSGYDGTLECRRLSLKKWDSNGNNVEKMWIPFTYLYEKEYPNDANSQYVDRLKFTSDYGVFNQSISINGCSLYTEKREVNGLTNTYDTRLVCASFAPRCIDATGLASYINNEIGSVFARRFYAIDGNYTKTASISSAGNAQFVGLTMTSLNCDLAIKNTSNVVETRITRDGAGTFSSLTVGGKSPVLYTIYNQVNNSINASGNINCLNLFVNGTKRIDSDGVGTFASLTVGGKTPVLHTTYNNVNSSVNLDGNLNSLNLFVNGTKRIDSDGAASFDSLTVAGSGTFGSLTVGSSNPVLFETYGGSTGSVRLDGNLNALSIYVNGVQRITSSGAASFASCTVNGYNVITTGADILYAGTSSNSSKAINGLSYNIDGTVVINSSRFASFTGCKVNGYDVKTTYNDSDIRLKKDVKLFDKSAKEIVNSVPVKSFTWKKDDKRVLAGFIAQDLEKLDNLHDDKETAVKYVEENQQGTKVIDQEALIPILWKAVQELTQEVKDLKEALYGRNN